MSSASASPMTCVACIIASCDAKSASTSDSFAEGTRMTIVSAGRPFWGRAEARTPRLAATRRLALEPKRAWSETREDRDREAMKMIAAKSALGKCEESRFAMRFSDSPFQDDGNETARASRRFLFFTFRDE